MKDFLILGGQVRCEAKHLDQHQDAFLRASPEYSAHLQRLSSPFGVMASLASANKIILLLCIFSGFSAIRKLFRNLSCSVCYLLNALGPLNTNERANVLDEAETLAVVFTSSSLPFLPI